MIAAAANIFSVSWDVQNARPFTRMIRGKRTLTLAAILFTIFLILNLVWPYGSTA